MAMRGLRGAMTLAQNTKEDIWHGAQEMVQEILRRNELKTEDIGAVIFSMTEDLTAAFPSAGLRQLAGFDFVPLFDTRQCAVEGTMPLCLRVLILADLDIAQRDVRHVYLGGAASLRPDLSQK